MDDHTADAPFDEADIASLAAKLATLELSEREQSALRALLSDEVAGFAGRFDVAGVLGGELTNLRDRGIRVFGIRAAGVRNTGIRATRRTPGSGGPRSL
jgi:hypothetical protein